MGRWFIRRAHASQVVCAASEQLLRLPGKLEAKPGPVVSKDLQPGTGVPQHSRRRVLEKWIDARPGSGSSSCRRHDIPHRLLSGGSLARSAAHKLMARQVSRTVLLAIAMYVVAGCGTTHVEDSAISRTRQGLSELQTGFTEEQVLQAMGSPAKVRAYPRYAKHLYFWLYLARGKDATGVYHGAADYVFLAFEEGALRAWGRDHEVIPISRAHPLRLEE